MDYVEGWEKRERKNHIMRLTKQLRKNKMLYGVAWAKGREAVAVSSLTGIQQFKCRQLGVPGLLIQEYPHDQTLACNQHWSCTTGKEMSPWEFWDQCCQASLLSGCPSDLSLILGEYMQLAWQVIMSLIGCSLENCTSHCPFLRCVGVWSDHTSSVLVFCICKLEKRAMHGKIGTWEWWSPSGGDGELIHLLWTNSQCL